MHKQATAGGQPPIPNVENSLMSELEKIREQIETERKILDGLVGEAQEKGIAIGDDKRIMEHSRKFDELVVRHAKFMENHKCYFKYMLLEYVCIED